MLRSTYSSYSDLLKLTNQQLDKSIRSHSLVPKNKHLEKIDQLSSVLHLKPHEIIKYEDLCKLNELELKDLLRRNNLEVIGKRTHHLAQLSSIYKFNQSTSVLHQHICEIKNSVKGWTQNLKYLPSTTLSQIVEYLLNAHDIKTCSSNLEEFTSETLKRYKALRSYELWASGHIHSVRFNNLADSYSYCALRCKSNPSWDTSGTVYDTCIVLDKSSGKPLGGHCSCVAGLIEACSHVAGLLFGLEDIVTKGLTELPDISCTSILCSWSAPKSKNIQVKPLKDVPIIKRGPLKVVKKKNLKSSIFNPVNPLKAGVKFEKAQQLFHELNLCRPNLPCLQSVDLNKWRPVNNKSLQTFGPSALKDIYNYDAVELVPSFITDIYTELLPPKSILEKSKYLASKRENTNIHDFMTSLCYTNSEISAIESLTRKQSENKNWFHYRKCAITSSKIHNIYTRVKSGKTLLDHGNNDWLIEDIMGNSKFKGNINTAYGLIHEKDAASDYLKEKQKTHIGCNLIEKGLIFSNEGWFATSVDRIFSCSCCKDKIIVEIKCPKTIENKQTSDFINSINYLKPDENGQAHLIPSHTYYTQIQSQMAITKIHKADFVVWSSNGIISNTMSFDKDFWNDVYDKAKSFYTTIIVPKLMSNEMQ